VIKTLPNLVFKIVYPAFGTNKQNVGLIGLGEPLAVHPLKVVIGLYHRGICPEDLAALKAFDFQAQDTLG